MPAKPVAGQQYVVLLRAIAHVSMAPFREAMEEMGFFDVESFGMSGNLLFKADETDAVTLERRIAERFRTDAFVRSRTEIRRIARQNPFGRGQGASVYFLAKAPDAARRREFTAAEFEAPAPVMIGKTLFFVHPTRLKGKRAPYDFERALAIKGTARSAGVVEQLVQRLMRGNETAGRIRRATAAIRDRGSR